MVTVVLLAWMGHLEAAGDRSESQVTGPMRDPFTTSARMYAESERFAANSPGGRGFIPSVGFEQVPKMKLRGFVDNRQAVALLEIEGVGTYLVRKGDEIGLQALGKNTVIKILDVNGMSVKVQTGMINQVIVVR